MKTDTGSQLDASNYQEVVYNWDAGSHDILGTSPDVFVARIRTDLADFFDASRDPASRSVIAFRESVSGLLTDENLLATATERDNMWSDSLDSITTPDGETNLRVNPVLGVLRHFLWIADVFHSVPSASVLIR